VGRERAIGAGVLAEHDDITDEGAEACDGARRRRAGFTMIEMIVAMAILAVMVAAGLGLYSDVRRKSNDNIAIGMAQQLAANLQHYAALDGGAYPAGEGAANWPAIMTALRPYQEFTPTVPVLFSAPGGIALYTDAVGSTYQIMFASSGGASAYCLDPNGLSTMQWNGGNGPWAGCP